MSTIDGHSLQFLGCMGRVTGEISILWVFGEKVLNQLSTPFRIVDGSFSEIV